MTLSENLERELRLFKQQEKLPDELAIPYMMHFYKCPDVPASRSPVISEYDIARWNGHGNSENGMYHDTDSSFVLRRNNTPAAVCGFVWKTEPTNWPYTNDYTDFYAGTIHRYRRNEIELPDDAILVLQLQARRGHNDTEPFRWERMLVALTADWAHETGFSRIAGLPAIRNRWQKVNRNYGGNLRYDVTFEREGFKYDPKLRLFVREL